jgi:uncharacterized protein (DUF302 family)
VLLFSLAATAHQKGLTNAIVMIKIKGIANRRSYHSVEETLNILQAYLQEQGATIYARIDQRAEAAKVGLKLSPLQVILFGNPKRGVPAMQQNPTVALDLPLKIIAWEDQKQKVWLTYNKEGYIRKRYALPKTLVSPLNIELMLDAALRLKNQGTQAKNETR